MTVVKKHWTINEITGGAVAYLEATQNAVQGTDQTHDDFKMDLLDRWLKAAPAIPPPDLWSDRLDRSLDGAAQLYKYIRDSIIKPLQKFNSSLRAVELSQPSGTSQDQNLNMAYAIFMNKTKTMDYNFKDFDIKKWKLYLSYNHLKLMPKLMLCDSTTITVSKSDDTTRGRGTKKGNKAAKKELGELKRKAFRDAERERREKRDVERDDDTQESLNDVTEGLNQVKDTLELFRMRLESKDRDKNQRMMEKNQRMMERNQRKVEKTAMTDKKMARKMAMTEKKNQMREKKNKMKGTIALLKAETNSDKRIWLIARLSQLSADDGDDVDNIYL